MREVSKLKKRIIALLCMLSLISGLCPVCLASAVSTAVYESGELNIAKGATVTYDLGGVYTKDISVEIDYDLSNVTWSGNCNLPMILCNSKGNEIGRISIYSEDKALLSTRMENGTIVNTGAVDRKGTLRIETDLSAKRLVFKYLNGSFKPCATLGYLPFADSAITDFAKLKIGAGGNPGVACRIRAYNTVSNTMEAEYSFDTDYTGALSAYQEFSGCGSGVAVRSDPTDASQKALYVPKENNLRMIYMPINYGFSGNISLSYRLYLVGDTVQNAPLGTPQNYITGKTTDIFKLMAESSTTVRLTANDTKYTVTTDTAINNRWVDIECFLDLTTHKATVKLDGRLFTAENGAAAIDIPSEVTLFNQLQTQNNVCDMYADDIKITSLNGDTVLSSEVYEVDNFNRKISGVDMLSTADEVIANISLGGNTAKILGSDGSEKAYGLKPGDTLALTSQNGKITVSYAIEFFNYRIDFEGNVTDTYSGGAIAEAPYGGSGRALKSNTAEAGKTLTVNLPTDTEYDTVEFKLCFENNTANAQIILNNSDGGIFSKLYVFNQETLAFLGESAYNHTLTTQDRAWQRYKAVIDRENDKVKWYIDGRALQTEPIEFANLYKGDDTLSAVSVSVTAGAYAYIDDITLSDSPSTEITAESSVYSVESYYKMITGIPHGTAVSELTAAVEPHGSVFTSDGRLKSEDESVEIGDLLRLSSGNVRTEYALGLTEPARTEAELQNPTELFVSESGADENPGTRVSPYKTLEAAFEKAAELEGDVKITVMGDTFGGGCIKGINKDNGNILLTSEAELIGGRVIDYSAFRALTAEEKQRFTAAPDKILCADISGVDFGTTRQSGWNLPFLPSSAELVVNGEAKTAARYPNEGYIKSGSIVSSSSTGLTFVYSDTELESWQNTENARVWSHFDVTYGGHDAPITAIDTAQKTIALGGTMYSTNVKNPIEYYIYNVPEALDVPGEYYIDAEKGLLYYYPEEGETEAAVITGGEDAILRFENCSGITLSGITVTGGRGNGIEISGCNNVTVKGCEISGQGMNGVTITGGALCGVENSRLHHVGGDAVKLYGGDVYTLSEAGHFVNGCDIHDFSLRKKSYTSAVTTSGCGMKISNNRIYNAPHTGIFLRSCETEIFGNSFKNLTYDAQDMGCIYSVDSYIRRGVKIHDNYFEGIRNRYKEGTALVKCVYMDNFISGWSVYNNVFYDCDQGIHANGGRDNQVYSNLFISTDLPLGMYSLKNASFTTAPLYQSSFAPLGSTVWSAHYPDIDQLANIYPGYPYAAAAYGNVIVGGSRNEIAANAYMNISDSKTLSQDKARGALVTDYGFCEAYIKPITKNINCDRVVIDGLTPFSAELHLKKGEKRAVSVVADGKTVTPETLKSSNEIRIRAEGGYITAAETGTAKITVGHGDFSQTITVVCE